MEGMIAAVDSVPSTPFDLLGDVFLFLDRIDGILSRELCYDDEVRILLSLYPVILSKRSLLPSHTSSDL